MYKRERGRERERELNLPKGHKHCCGTDDREGRQSSDAQGRLPLHGAKCLATIPQQQVDNYTQQKAGWVEVVARFFFPLWAASLQLTGSNEEPLPRQLHVIV